MFKQKQSELVLKQLKQMLKVSTRNQKSVDKIDSISVFAQSFDDIGVNE